jgi:signal transduction histidine kinase
MVMSQQQHASPRPARGLARGVARWPGRYLAWARRHPRLVDAALVAVLLVLAVPSLIVGQGSSPLLTLVLIVALLLPLVWRRRAPFPVFLIVAAAALADWRAGQPMSADLAPLVAFYTVAAYEPSRRILIAAGVLELGAVLAAMRFAPRGAGLVLFIFITGMITAAGLIGYNIRTRRAYLAALEDRAAQLEADRDREAQLAAAAERARIAREMHDIVAHNIAVMIALADGAAYTSVASPDRAAAIMGQVSDTGRSALTEMRRLLGVMRQPADPAGQNGAAIPDGRPGHTPQPTLDDVEDLLTTVRAAGLPTRLTVSGQRLALPPSAQLAIYRLIQEALTNTLKHAAATAAWVHLAYRPDAVELEVTDNGRAAGERSAGGGPEGIGSAGSGLAGNGAGGHGAADDGSPAGHGIAGMRERAAVFGGQVSAGPQPGGGWRVHTTLRLDPEIGIVRGTAVTGGTEGP